MALTGKSGDHRSVGFSRLVLVSITTLCISSFGSRTPYAAPRDGRATRLSKSSEIPLAQGTSTGIKSNRVRRPALKADLVRVGVQKCCPSCGTDAVASTRPTHNDLAVLLFSSQQGSTSLIPPETSAAFTVQTAFGRRL